MTRKYDVMIIDQNEGLINLSFKNTIGTGILKTIQRFIILLFTKTNSNIFNGFGTIFADNINTGNISLKKYLSFSLNDIINIINTDAEYDDEIIDGAQLVDMADNKNTLSATIELQIRDNNYSIIIPIKR